jgi:hypothetical protein
MGDATSSRVRCGPASGFAYVAVLIILFVLTALGMAFILRAGLMLSAVSASTESSQAQYLAESAANHAMWRLMNEGSFPVDSDKYYMHSLGAGRYGYKVRRHTDTTYATIASVGAVGDTVINQSFALYIPPPPVSSLCEDGLIAYYNFNEVSGTDINDSSASLEHAAIQNGEGDELVNGYMSGAVTFDGADDKIQTTDGSSLVLSGDYSTSVWIKPNATQKIWAGIYSKTNSSGSQNHWNLQFNNDSERDIIVYHGSGGGSPWDTGIDLADVADQWSNIIITRSGNTMTSYLNGVVSAVGNVTNNPMSGAGHLNIGAERTFSNSYLYAGLIDELRIYDRTIDASEIANLAAKGCECLQGHWKLDDGAGSAIATDSSPWSNDGSLRNMDPSTDWVSAVIADGLDYAASSEHVFVPYASEFNFGVGPLTAAFWFRKEGTSQSDSFSMVENDGDGFVISLQPDNTMDVSFNGTVVSNGSAFTLNDWHHAALTRDPDGNLVTYIDGATDGSGTSGADLSGNLGDLFFGTNYDFGGPFYTNPLDGQLDDIRLYSRALNSVEIADLAGVLPGGSDDIVVSTDSSAVLASLSFDDDDVVSVESGVATEIFDGGTEFSGNENLDAFHIMDTGNYLLSTHNSAVVGGLSIEKHDIAEFDPNTGIATLYMDGDTHLGANENINGISMLPNGNLAISTLNPATLGALSFRQEDVVEYDPGTMTATMLFDGSVHLSNSRTIDGVHVEQDGNLLLSVADGGESIGALDFDIYDVVRFDVGITTASLYFDGEVEFGNTTENVDAISFPVVATIPKVYWIDSSSQTLFRGDNDGANEESLVTGLTDPRGLARDESSGKIYWVEGSAIFRANEDGTGQQSLVTGQNDITAFELDLVNNKIYWADKNDGIISRSNLDGTAVEDIVTDQVDVSDLTIDTANGFVYWADNDDDTIRRAELDGSNEEDVASGQLDVVRMALDMTNSYLYWAEKVDGVIRRIAVASGAVVIGHDTIFASQQGSVNWKQLGTQVVASQDLTVTEIVAYVGGKKDKDMRYALYSDSAGEPGALVVESATAQQSTDAYGWVTIDVADTPVLAGTYWLALAFDHGNQNYTYDDGTGETRYNNTDAAADGFDASWGSSTASLNRRISIYANTTATGGSVETIVASVTNPVDLALDLTNGKVYWADKDDQKVKRANLNGSSEEDVATGVADPTFISLDVNNDKIYWGDKDDQDIKSSELDGSNVATLFTGMADPKYFEN